AGARTPRSRMLLVGAGVAGVVLAGGLLWPTGGEDSSATDAVVVRTGTDRPEDPAATPAAPSSSPEGTEPTGAKDERGTADAANSTPIEGSIEAAVADLLVIFDECRAGEDAECAQATVGGAGVGILERLGPGSASRDVSLIEDY